MSQAKIFFSSD